MLRKLFIINMLTCLLILMGCAKKEKVCDQSEIGKITTEITRLKKLKQDTIDTTIKYNVLLSKLKSPIDRDDVIKKLGLENIYKRCNRQSTFNGKYAQHAYLKNGKEKDEIGIYFFYFAEAKDGRIIKSKFIKAIATNDNKIDNTDMLLKLLEGALVSLKDKDNLKIKD
ncbi:MAG: hypothetical protein COA79_22280 [Planctomycetota bacterium]|nr:MAG: hypothetical protein COA79_22280 [Planctomycetota bacterium]